MVNETHTNSYTGPRLNLKTRNNHSLDVQEVVLCKKMNLSVVTSTVDNFIV